VVLQVGPQRTRAANALRSLIEQEAIDRMEVLLLDYAADEFPPIVGSDHPNVRLLRRDSLEPFGRSRSEAVGMATGRVVAFVEDHCQAHPGWADAVLDAHDRGYHGVGPEVHNGNPGVGISDAVHLINYFRWLPPAVAGETSLIVGHNSSYLRETILAYGEELATLLRCDTVLQWRLAQDGYHLCVSPDVRISHFNETDLPSLFKGSFLWNRMFAPTRAHVFHWSAPKRLAWLILSPLIPFVRSIKLLIEILQRRRNLFWLTVAALPITFAAHSAAAAGQWIGLAAGLGDTEIAFLNYEITRNRGLAPGIGGTRPA
jgi:Glycosyl transferase family 2